MRALLGSRAVFAPPLSTCYAITLALHVGSIALSTLLPFQMVDLGGSRTQVGLLFSVMTVVSMVLRPTIGAWVDQLGARTVILPGVASLALTSLALQIVASPEILIVLMIGLGLANGLVSTPASVLTATSPAPAHRGESLATYYLASSVGIAVAPPLAFALREAGGMPLAFAVVTAIALVLVGLASRLPAGPAADAPTESPRLRLFSKRALPTSGALVLATLGHSSVYAFLPLYAVGRGQGAALAWFFGVYPVWLIVCRALLRGILDRFDRAHVALVAMALQAVAYLLLAPPPGAVTLVLAALALGAGSAVLYPALAALVVDRADHAERGLALGTLSGSWDLGVVVGSALIGLVAERVSYGAGFALGALGGVLGVLALALGESRRAAGGAVAQPLAGRP